MSKGQGLWEHAGSFIFGVVKGSEEFNLLKDRRTTYGASDIDYDPGEYPSVNKRLSPKELATWKT